jgi:hypothetical protein
MIAPYREEARERQASANAAFVRRLPISWITMGHRTAKNITDQPPAAGGSHAWTNVRKTFKMDEGCMFIRRLDMV